MSDSLNFTITPVWAVIDDIRNQIKAELSTRFQQDILDFTLICAVELVENAVKYGESVPETPFIRFRLNTQNGSIEIEVSNGVVNATDLNFALETIREINESDDHEKLYLDRLMELMEKKDLHRSRLGLYRISNETGFELSCRVENKTLTVRAERKLEP